MPDTSADFTVEEGGAYFLIASVRFYPAGSLYNFLVESDLELRSGDWVVVETVHGPKTGRIVEVGCDLPSNVQVSELRRVLRRASGLDMVRRQILAERAKRVTRMAQESVQEHAQREAKIITTEYTLDGEKAMLFYRGKLSSGLQSRIQEQVSSTFGCRVELHSVGPRDEAKLLGGYGVCGEPRCCARFLTDFKPISIHMAKDQAISLAPTDITGMCGRLRCCLDYEHQVYKEASDNFPRRRARVQTDLGLGRVIDWDVLKGDIIVEIPPTGPRRERKRHRFKVDEVEVVPRKK
ncbi:MAG: PSP1 domain-containing protein [Anaerolineae bacterium]